MLTHRWLNWGLAAVLRMDRNSLMPSALKWTSPGKTKRDRRMGTCRTVEEEKKLAGKTRIELSWPDQDRAGWRRFVGA